ncbi:hypothetical protein GF386_02480 [Candidatus Pacearchaeota archaeon]|nr:hypothetical protein [Candidatus Pacearchaeota archaeon]MBD3283010.1 hypothetical protein [Candidatus Pacearchaeota archaeon]
MEMVNCDLHFHAGRHGRGNFDDIVRIGCERLGRGGILGLVNCDDYRYENIVDGKGRSIESYEIGDLLNGVWVPEHDFYVVRGQEVFSESGHFLVFGFPKRTNIESKQLYFALEVCRDSSHFKGLDHKDYKSGMRRVLGKALDRNLGYFDFDETFNASAELSIGYANATAQAHYDSVIKDREFENPLTGESHKIGEVAFTDAHSLGVIGRSYTRVEALPETCRDDSLLLISELKDRLRVATRKDQVRRPNRLDAAVHAFHLVVTNKILG